MSPDQKAVVKDTWSQLGPVADDFTRQFYDRVFEIDPSLRGLFESTDMPAQRQKVIQAFAMVVAGLDNLEALVPGVQDLGRRHVGYGVQDDHYATVGQALLQTFEQTLGPAWTDEAKDAWSTAYATLSGVMRDAASQAGA